MLTVNRIVCRSTRTALPVYTSNATCAYATKSGDWLQKDKLQQKLKAISDEYKTRQQRLEYAEKILPYYVMFPNEADPTKPSKEAVEATVKQAFHVQGPAAVPVPNWKEAVAKAEKEHAEQVQRVVSEHQKKDKSHAH